MDKKVLCPYCGGEMKSEDWVKVDGGYLSYAVCSNDACQSIGPTVTGYETMAEARAAALSAAQARYLPPNRPLTLDEAKALDADEVGDIPRFAEVEPNWYEKDPDDFGPRLCADVMCIRLCHLQQTFPYMAPQSHAGGNGRGGMGGRIT